MIEFKNLTAKRIKYTVYKKLYKKIFKNDFTLSVVFVPPPLMRKLNREYRRKDKTANVLSFALDKNYGEIFLNADEKELPYLFLHGALHLLGYDHKKNSDADKMEKLEKKIFPPKADQPRAGKPHKKKHL